MSFFLGLYPLRNYSNEGYFILVLNSFKSRKFIKKLFPSFCSELGEIIF